MALFAVTDTAVSVTASATNRNTQPPPPNPTPLPPFLPSPYPASTRLPTATKSITTPPPSPQPLSTPSPLPNLQSSPSPAIYLPLINKPNTTPTFATITSLDFDQIQRELNAQGEEIVYAKIGFHTGIGYQSENLVAWMIALDAAGIPFFLKSTDNAEPIFIAQELKRRSGVPHTLVYRRVTNEDYNLDVPNYDLPPAEAAVIHWQEHMKLFPPELDPSLVWIETVNEIDKNRAEWMGQFALKTAELAMRDGFNWAAFGWASGEPEPEQWQTPSMLAFLDLAGNNPDRLAIALHEYSYTVDDITDGAPYKIGRFEQLFQIADENNIPRPTILITEWGWEYMNVPPPEQALRDIAWANQLYAPYPELKGAAIWYLGGGFADIATQTEQLILPVTEYSLQTYFTRPLE